MKKLLLLLLTATLFVNCSNDDGEWNEVSNPSNFSMTVNAADLEDLSICVHLFKCQSEIFDSVQDVDDLIEMFAVDVSGEKHHAFYSFGTDGRFIKHPLQDGFYFLCVIINETGKYTCRYLHVEEDRNYFLEKSFVSAFPEKTYEGW